MCLKFFKRDNRWDNLIEKVVAEMTAADDNIGEYIIDGDEIIFFNRFGCEIAKEEI